MFIFVLQAIWLYIGDLAGKDLDTFVILKLLAYLTPTLVPLILPLTILLVSIMVFGAFAENYEFAAMKSTGISLQRAMRSLSVFIVFLGVIVFIFSNNVIPWANYNVYNLRKNIAKVKPALAITAGQFNEIGSYNIKIESKSGDNDEFLKKVVIHEKSSGSSTNRKVIIAERGELISSENSNILQLVLFDGNRYEEIYNRRNAKQNLKKPHAKSYFETYTINVDIEGLNDVDIDDKSYDNRYNMLNISELEYTIDSLYEKEKTQLKNFSNTLYRRTSITTLYQKRKPTEDSIQENKDNIKGNILEIFNDRTKIQLLGLASNTLNSTRQIIKTNQNSFAISTKWFSKHVISLHEKYVLGLACIILFFVGAPLGALIRKGGIGLPLVIAILLFLTYHFIGIFAKNSSHDGTFSPVLATWLSTAIMLPLGVYLTSRATKDRGIFEFDHITQPVKKLFRKKGKKKNEATSADQLNVDQSVLENLQLLTKEKTTVIDIERFDENRSGYKLYGKVTLVLYYISIPILVLHFILKNNNLPVTADVFIKISAVGLVAMAIIYTITTIKFYGIYKQVKETKLRKNPIFIILGFAFYPLAHFFRNNKISEDFSSDND